MIEIKNLVKKFGKNTVLKGVTFSVNKGEVLGFLGPNGAGKSTTMNIITGYLSSTSGSVVINGHDILEEPELAKKSIGYLPELPPLYLDMTVREYLRFMADIKGVRSSEKDNQITKIMSLVKISNEADRLINNLSKGYKQRVGIAQALIGNPEILILDEPTVGLDPSQIREIRKLIRLLAKNHTIILSSHILSEVQAVCDRVIIIDNGKIVAADSMNDISKKVNKISKLLVVFRGDSKLVAGTLKAIKGVNDIFVRETGNNDINRVELSLSSNDPDIRTTIFYTMTKLNCPIIEMKTIEYSLEEIFLSLTNVE